MTFISDVYIWHCNLSLTFLSDIYIWHLYLTFIRFSDVNSKVYWFTHGSPNPLFYRCIFSPHQKQHTFSKNSNATRRIWATLAAPVVANSGQKKHVHFPYVNSKVCWFTHGSPNSLFYRCNFFAPSKTIHFFKQLERNSPHLSNTGGSRRRQ